MGIIFPKELSARSKIFIPLLLTCLSPILIVVLLLYFFWGAILYLAVWTTRKKQFVVFVYSDSPTWGDYIEREILHHIQDRAIILNWSERRKWKNSLAVLVFRYFGGQRDFNPIALVFRPFHLVKTYRFFKAFKEFKYGNPEKVEKLRKELFEILGV